jgi:hypothetical protein
MDVISGHLGGHFFTHTHVHRMLVPTKASPIFRNCPCTVTTDSLHELRNAQNSESCPEQHFTKLDEHSST